MQTNRRNWLKQAGIVAAGLGIVPLNGLSTPLKDTFAYKPADGKIRLNANENPYGPSPMARVAMAEQINASNRYNWDLGSALKTAIAQKHNVSEDNILLGAGSTEILDLVIQVTGLDKDKEDKEPTLVLSDPTFGYWYGTGQFGIKKIKIPLTADKRLDLPAMLNVIKNVNTELVYICNPNNPTGTICDRGELIAFIKEATEWSRVLVDEAYLDFTDQRSLCDLVKDTKGLIIAKTFSKIYGMAGARIGYAIGGSDIIDWMSRFQLWPNGAISTVSGAGALASLNDTEFLRTTYSLNEKVRKYTIEQLEALNINCIHSHTNFIYFSLANYRKDFFVQLENNNIIGTRIYEEEGKWSRITVGTMEQMQQFIAAIS